MPAAPLNPLDRVRKIEDPRRRLGEALALLELASAFTGQARETRDRAIADLGRSGVGKNELAALSGMSTAHVNGCLRRFAPED